jgi:DnaA family protein
MDIGKQLPLGLSLKDNATFANFYPGDNVVLLEALAGRESPVFVWGSAGSGKSHLLQAVCHAAAGQGLPPAYLPLAQHARLAPAMLEGLEQQAVVTVDDVHCIVGQADWEEALFHLFNRLREAGNRLVVSARCAPAALNLGLPDLVSRLGWGPVFQLQPLDDEGKRAALQLRARQRGMELPDEVAVYLLRRSPRDMDSLFELLQRLDVASLAAQRRLTIPFVRALIA